MSNEIQALLTEREGYLRRGLKDRARQVEDVLASLGYVEKKKETATVEPDAERAVSTRASKRRA